MSELEDLTQSTAVRGILPDALVAIVSIQWFRDALEVNAAAAARTSPHGRSRGRVPS